MNQLVLQLTQQVDLCQMVAFETDPPTRCWLGETGEYWHRRAISDGTQEHLTAVLDGTGAIGFVVLAGLGQVPSVIEIRRVVIGAEWQGLGHGRALLRAAIERARALHGATKVWLDVKPGNRRARALYGQEGFREERLIADAMAEPDGTFSDLIIMTLDLPTN